MLLHLWSEPRGEWDPKEEQDGKQHGSSNKLLQAMNSGITIMLGR